MSTELVPETLEHVDRAFVILHTTVSEMRASRTGALRVVTEDGVRIDVPPGGAYENWTVLLPDGLQLIGLPGGDVAILPPKH